MAGNASIRVVCFVVLAACAGLGQKSEEQRTRGSLPDAPSSVQVSSQGFGTAGANGAVGDGSGAARATLVAVFRAEPQDKASSDDFFAKHLYPTLLKKNLNYHPSDCDSLFGRATYAASRIFLTRDETGKGRLNTSYLVAVLSSAMVHTAYRPYWNRSAAAPFSDFGSTIGNDAGMNVLHEFAPGLQQLVKSHTPRFVARIEERVGR